MNGVEILNQTEIMKTVWSAEIFLITFSVCLLLGLVLGIARGLVEHDILVNITVGLICGLVVGGLIGLLLGGGGTKKMPTGTYEYQVTISDEVNLNEFLKKYEIISQEGKIYTVILIDETEVTPVA